jgi:UDP-N-acetylglucosamine 2-epimerase (non-hydrolysing)
VLTDSGGIQEETTSLGVPCVTLRDNTERPITVEHGTNTLVGQNPARIVEVVEEILRTGGKAGKIPELWDGKHRSGLRRYCANGWTAASPSDWWHESVSANSLYRILLKPGRTMVSAALLQ